MLADIVDGVIGVDTHRDTLAAAATTPIGRILAQTATSADAAGYRACSTSPMRRSPTDAAGRWRGPAAMAPD